MVVAKLKSSGGKSELTREDQQTEHPTVVPLRAFLFVDQRRSYR